MATTMGQMDVLTPKPHKIIYKQVNLSKFLILSNKAINNPRNIRFLTKYALKSEHSFPSYEATDKKNTKATYKEPLFKSGFKNKQNSQLSLAFSLLGPHLM